MDLRYPIYAFIAAVLVTDLQPATSRNLGIRRLAATVIGAVWGALLTQFLPSTSWAIGAGVFVAMLTSQLLKAEEGARVAGYICGIILLDHSFEPWAYAFHRFLETVIGILAALAISYVPKFFFHESNTSDTH
ncbi:FUSC family protein [Aestuariivirga sp.]|uniref:FUSC family protein n=1 Tax=Aestuariivirga sp. TaxID=2650926 RepID=UPI003BAB2923